MLRDLTYVSRMNLEFSLALFVKCEDCLILLHECVFAKSPL